MKRVNQASKRKKRWKLRVLAIDPATYLSFKDDPGHPFSGMEPERRLEEIVSFCSTLWARACEEAARKPSEKSRHSDAA